jgi:hypothetical protein
MKEYVASVTFEGKIQTITREYDRKSDFYTDLRGNGYRVRFISTPEKFDEDCEKYHEACERNKYVKKLQYDSYKKSAERMNMTIKEYKAWLKA